MAELRPESPFLGLPGELKNRIYRFAVTGIRVNVTLAGLAEPGLLSTCKIIRKEAGPLFYSENSFKLQVRAYEPMIPCKWTKKANSIREEFQLERGKMHVTLPTNFVPHWNNLSSWLRAHHTHDVDVALMPVPGASAMKIIVATMFDMVWEMHYRPWSVVETILLEQRRALVLMDRRWED